MQGANGSSPEPDEVSAARSQQKSSGKIPIVPLLSGRASAEVPANADGAAVRLSDLQAVAAALGVRLSSLAEQVLTACATLLIDSLLAKHVSCLCIPDFKKPSPVADQLLFVMPRTQTMPRVWKM